MALQELPLPIQGVNFNYPLDKQDAASSPYMNNVIPFDVLENQIRLSSRFGTDKAFTSQIGGASSGIVAMTAIVVTKD